MRIDIGRALLTAFLGSLASAPLGACGDDAATGTGGAGGSGNTGGAASTGVNAGGSGGGIVDPELTAPFLCEEGSEPFAALLEELGLDSIEHRQQQTGDGAITSLLVVGEPCASATDAPACELAVQEARSEESLFPICGNCAPVVEYLVSTEVDAVDVVADHEAMLAWLGPVDAPAKAWLVATQADYRAQCGEAWIREDGADHLLLTSLLLNDCPMQYADVLLRVRPDGSHEEVERVVLPETGGCAGRRPEGLAGRVTPREDEPALGAYFARIAHLEAASIDAFLILRDELAAHGAPAELLGRAEEAAEDEVRHAEAMRRLAERHGARFEPSTIARGPVRALEAMAIENAREGCVRESYGALEAMWQARFAADPEVRATFEAVAREEAQHAALSWDLAAWFEAKLDPEARARVAEARREASATLARELGARRRGGHDRTTGLPTAARARHLFAHLSAALA